MITTEETLPLTLSYPLERLYPLTDLIFFDIETTGLSPKTSFLYLIGALYCREGVWHLTQWLANKPEEEPDILTAFSHFAKNYKYLIHFNGASFDLPYLQSKYRIHSLDTCLESLQSIDLYRLFRPLKNLLKLMKMNLTALETFLDISRCDKFSGKDLIPIYHEYLLTGNPQLRKLLLLHNHDDLLGTASLLSLLSYTDMKTGLFKVIRTTPEYATDGRFTLACEIALDTPLPKPISQMTENGYVTAHGLTGRILIYGTSGTLKHFFPNYKDYYYLPDEDTALHKSVAFYVAKTHRIQAKKATCYCQKSGHFLPAMETTDAPIFKMDSLDKRTFVECTNDFLADTAALHRYLKEYLQRA